MNNFPDQTNAIIMPILPNFNLKFVYKNVTMFL